MSSNNPQNAFPDRSTALSACKTFVASSVEFPNTGPKTSVSGLITVKSFLKETQSFIICNDREIIGKKFYTIT